MSMRQDKQGNHAVRLRHAKGQHAAGDIIWLPFGQAATMVQYNRADWVDDEEPQDEPPPPKAQRQPQRDKTMHRPPRDKGIDW